ncbi:MAG: hypothetical protein GX279_13175 [Clostridiaceae bacterium]|jgi:hypothetical protein|nr:hypothetical protein [Clostridiaceae bacterium]
MLYVFIGCLAFGVFYSLASFLLGGHGDHDGGVDSGADIDVGHGIDVGADIDVGHGIDIGADIDVGHGVDIGADIDVGHGAVEVDAGHDGAHAVSHGDDAHTPSPFNPLVIASAITAFGAAGLISMTGFGLNSLMSTIVALGFSGAIGAALFFGVVKFMYGSQSNSVFSLDDLIGFEAEVITPLPEKGLGEIAYMAHGMRSTISARSVDGTEIQRGSRVIIREITGNAAVVQLKLTLDDIVFDKISEDGRGNREAKGPEDEGENTGGAGEIEEAENGKPRRNAGNIN